MTKKKDVQKRKANGQLLPGATLSTGRVKGSKNQITVLRENTELALRRYMDSPRRAALAQKALDRLFEMAAEGSDKEALMASKILLDKMLPNAKAPVEAVDATKGTPTVIQIINSTGSTTGKPVGFIEGDFEEIKVDGDSDD